MQDVWKEIVRGRKIFDSNSFEKYKNLASKRACCQIRFKSEAVVGNSINLKITRIGCGRLLLKQENLNETYKYTFLCSVSPSTCFRIYCEGIIIYEVLKVMLLLVTSEGTFGCQ